MLNNKSLKDLTDNNIIREMMSDNKKMINFNDLPSDIMSLIFKINRDDAQMIRDDKNKHKINIKNVLSDVKMINYYYNKETTHSCGHKFNDKPTDVLNYNDMIYHLSHMTETREIYNDDNDYDNFNDADWVKYYYDNDDGINDFYYYLIYE